MAKINLPPDLEAWARAEVAAGRAQSVEALVARVVREHADFAGPVRAKLGAARQSIAGGASIPLDEMLAELDAWIDEDESATRTARTAAE